MFYDFLRRTAHAKIAFEFKHLYGPFRELDGLTLEKLLAKRNEFQIEEEDFVGVGSHITLLDGRVVPVSGALQPDERRMLENTFKLIQQRNV